MADIIQASHGDAQQVENAKKFLCDYLLSIRSTEDSNRIVRYIYMYFLLWFIEKNYFPLFESRDASLN